MAPRINPVLSSFIIVGSGAVASLIWAVFTEPFPTSPSTASITAMLLVGLLPTAFAMFVYVWLIQRAGPVFVSFTTYMQPLWAAAIAVLFMGEELHWTMLGAMVLILIGVAIANRKSGAP
jgi:drug/metabolite transporter (DMT)-like permease